MAGDGDQHDLRGGDGYCVLTFALADPWPCFAHLAREPFFSLEARLDGGFRAALRPIRVEILRQNGDVTAFRRAFDRMVLAAAEIPREICETEPVFPITGLLGFEAGARFEPFRRRERLRRSFPEGIFLLYDLFLDWQDGIARIVSFGAGPGGLSQARARRRAHIVLAGLKCAGESSRPVPSGRITPVPPKGRYGRMVEKLRAEIARGDLFQANLASPFCVRLHPRDAPLALFRRLIAASPAQYSTFLQLRKDVLISNSPELFLASTRAADHSLRIHSLPIKGTAQRLHNSVEDRLKAASLAASEKDRAENRMIVDLMRNDFSRVAAIGSVAVPEMFAVQSLPNVHHLVSRIEATLAPGRGPADVISACFPPGSVTGAPKPAALKAIARHERYPRGPWCGTLFRTDGRSELVASVLIRSLALHWHRRRKAWGGTAFAGAGITILSDPVAETAETHAKMQMIAQAVSAGAHYRKRRQ